jgi:hypothetical protein
MKRPSTMSGLLRPRLLGCIRRLCTPPTSPPPTSPSAPQQSGSSPWLRQLALGGGVYGAAAAATFAAGACVESRAEGLALQEIFSDIGALAPAMLARMKSAGEISWPPLGALLLFNLSSASPVSTRIIPRVAFWTGQLTLGGMLGYAAIVPVMRAAVYRHTEPTSAGRVSTDVYAHVSSSADLWQHRARFVAMGCTRETPTARPVLPRAAFEEHLLKRITVEEKEATPAEVAAGARLIGQICCAPSPPPARRPAQRGKAGQRKRRPPRGARRAARRKARLTSCKMASSSHG